MLQPRERVVRAPCGTGTRLLRKQPCRPADVPSAFTHSYMYLCDFDIIMSMQPIAELRIAVILGADRRGCRCYDCKQAMSKVVFFCLSQHGRTAWSRLCGSHIQ